MADTFRLTDIGSAADGKVYTFAIPGAAAEALQLDFPAMNPGTYHYSHKRVGARGFRYVVVADEKAARAMLQECEDRAAPQGREGFDQPASYGPACRIAAKRIRAELEKIS